MTDQLIIDAEHPWPWLEAFPETTARFFNGRDEDAETLLRCVLASPVTVLFSKSGMGKSSLLQAGLFPLLREQRLLPVYVRLTYGKDDPCASEQIARRWRHEIERSQLQLEIKHLQDPSTPLERNDSRDPGDSAPAANIPLADNLWAELHDTGVALTDSDGRRWYPVFVLDQFEEIFTLCAMDPERQKQTFFELGDLLENRIPKTLAERLHTDDSLLDRLDLDVQHYRFLLSLREDYLPDMEEWTDLIPRLGPNRYRLLPMSYAQAIAAVEKTGGTLVTRQDAENIVRYLSESQEQALAAESRPHRRRGVKVQVEPALLSLMCSGLNAERLAESKSRLDTTNLDKKGGLIVERFYDAAFEGQPECLREFVEQCLITADGVRLPYPVRSVEAEKLATSEQIDTLVNRRLIRRENLENGDRIELVHDRLAQVALKRRQEAGQRAEAERQRRRQRRLWFGTGFFMALLLIFAGFMAHATWKAERALRDATALRLVAESEAMTSGIRPGGTVRGLLQVLAAHRLARSANTDEALQTEYLKFRSLLFLRDHPTAITSVAFSPDGRRLVSGSGDGSLWLWDVFESWAEDLCKKLDRNMSYREWRDWVSPDFDYEVQCPGLPIPLD